MRFVILRFRNRGAGYVAVALKMIVIHDGLWGNLGKQVLDVLSLGSVKLASGRDVLLG